jgi:hypothetical protein
VVGQSSYRGVDVDGSLMVETRQKLWGNAYKPWPLHHYTRCKMWGSREGRAHRRAGRSGGGRRCRGGKPASRQRSAPRLSSLASRVGRGLEATLQPRYQRRAVQRWELTDKWRKAVARSDVEVGGGELELQKPGQKDRQALECSRREESVGGGFERRLAGSERQRVKALYGGKERKENWISPPGVLLL